MKEKDRNPKIKGTWKKLTGYEKRVDVGRGRKLSISRRYRDENMVFGSKNRVLYRCLKNTTVQKALDTSQILNMKMMI
jgi:hypothetical protein